MGRFVQLRRCLHLLACSTLVCQLTTCRLIAEDSWRQFRGNHGNGLALDASVPTQWSDSQNVTWKTLVHDRGWSSPVVEGDEVWLTTATEDGLKMYAMCISLSSGKILHDQLIFENQEVSPDYHVTNSYASPTPVLDDQYVFIHFGSYGTACLKRNDCSVVWQRRDLPCNHFRGAGSSPILFDDMLIFHMDGFDYQYAVALDRQTGETRWKVDRDIDWGTENGDFYKAFSTPIVIEAHGQTQLISPASMACMALNPWNGQEIWRVRYQEHSTTVSPVFDGNHLYISTGFGKAKMMCVRVDGSGDVTDTHVDWIQAKGIGSKPSPVLVGERLFDITDDGILARLDLTNGEAAWRTRLGGKFSASLIATSSNLIAVDHDGKGYVFSLSDEPELLAENVLPDGCNASPAIVGNSLLLRTTTHLYRFDAPSSP